MDGLLNTLRNNSNIAGFAEIYNTLTCRYNVVARFEYKGFCGERIVMSTCSFYEHRVLASRNTKDSLVRFHDGVKLIDGNLPKRCGYCRHPRVGDIGSYCVLEFESECFPCVSETDGGGM